MYVSQHTCIFVFFEICSNWYIYIYIDSGVAVFRWRGQCALLLTCLSSFTLSMGMQQYQRSTCACNHALPSGPEASSAGSLGKDACDASEFARWFGNVILQAFGGRSNSKESKIEIEQFHILNLRLDRCTQASMDFLQWSRSSPGNQRRCMVTNTTHWGQIAEG